MGQLPKFNTENEDLNDDEHMGFSKREGQSKMKVQGENWHNQRPTKRVLSWSFFYETVPEIWACLGRRVNIEFINVLHTTYQVFYTNKIVTFLKLFISLAK